MSLQNANNIEPVLYLEQIDRDYVNWRVYVRYLGNDRYGVYGTRRDKNIPTTNRYPYLRMNFLSRSSLSKWISTVLTTKDNRVNLTLLMINMDALISDDFVGYDNVNLRVNELVGYDKTYLTHQNIMTYLRLLRDHYAF